METVGALGASLSAASSATAVAAADKSLSSAALASSRSAAAMAAADMLAIVPEDFEKSALGKFIYAVLHWTPGVLLWVVTFITITLPSWLFTVFSTTLTISLNATTVLLIVLVVASTVSWIVRYRYLTMYSRLPPEPQRKEPEIDLFTDTQQGERGKPGLANYLDEFLSAIKVFGYLERPVFHELTRTMQTRKLVAGETLLLEEEQGFCLVVDGLVQIFVRTDRDDNGPRRDSAAEGQFDGFADDIGNDLNDPAQSDNHSHRGGDDQGEQYEDSHQGYQLLTEVRNGAAMSSLFSVLSLFAEDVKLRHEDETDLPRPRSAGHPASEAGGRPVRSPSPMKHIRRESGFDAALRRLSNVPQLSLDDEPFSGEPPNGLQSRDSPNALSRKKSAHPNIVARATADTTIAIIPASAFRRLTRVYPKATAHIVQVILSRLQRVTLATAHSYLGLTEDVALIEKSLNRFTSFDLPNHMRGAPLTRLKEKFKRERDRLSSADEKSDESKGIALHNPNAGRRRNSSVSLRKEAVSKMRLSTRANGFGNSPLANDYRSNVSPGDLLANVQMPNAWTHNPSASLGRSGGRGFFPSDREVTSPLARSDRPPFAASPRIGLQRQDSLDEDDIWRESIMNCITKAVGLTNVVDAFSKPESVEHSPRLVAFDRARQMGTFSNAFGFIDPYESVDGDSESVHSASVMSMGTFAVSREVLHQELRDDLEVVYFPKDAVLVEQGERNPGLYYLIDGFLDVSFPMEKKSVLPTSESGEGPHTSIFNTSSSTSPLDSFGAFTTKGEKKSSMHGTVKSDLTHRKSVYMAKPGDLAGYIGTVSSHRSFVDVRAKTDVYVGFLPRASVERLVEKYPMVLLTLAKRLTTMLPRLILQIDFALEWMQVPAGDVLHHQGDESDAIYIVLNGRLRGVQEKGQSDMRVVGEYGQGESVGELEVMTESTRPTTLHAIRDAEIARFPKTLFNSLAMEHAGITMKISKIIAQRMRALIEDPMFEKGKDKMPVAGGKNASSSLNLRTIAILPVTAGVPVVDFGARLLNALTQIGVPNGVTSLNYAAILNHLGRHAFSRMGKLKLSQYLADLEEIYGMLLYVADTSVNSPWTQTCISQADCILLVGLAEASPAIGEYERFLLGMKTTSRKELVLLHSDRYSPPGLTRKWLSNRLWINGGHHHIQMAFQAPTEPTNPQVKRFGAAIKQRVQILQAEIQKYTSRRIPQTPLYNSDTPFKGDFHRLARRLCGRSVGLVLGGGGARGIAQIGIIRALEEADIPIDIVGGTSIGAFNGALYAREGDVVPMYGRAKRFAGRMGSMWRFALDLTYPSISYTTGHEFNRGIYKTFGNSQIEDFWLPFYCNTTNITKSRSEIHNSGYVWRYVRASMSLAGLLPPLCDEGSMLLDGGYVDNLTVSHMKSLGADTIFAIDVGSPEDDTPQAFGDSLSGAWAIFNRWNPFSTTPNPPTLSEIQARLAYVSSVDAQRRAMKAPGCIFMRPPIDKYSTLEFASFDEIYDVGYKFGTEFLAKLRGKGVLPAMEETEERKKLRRTLAPRRASI